MVLEGYIEGLVNRFCGRWLTDFRRENLEINMVEGKVLMRDIVVNTHELEELCLPFTPRRIYLGRIFIQVPLNVSRPLKIQVTDCFVLVRASTTDSGFFDVRQALQSHINLLKVALESQFRALAACTTNLQQFLASAAAKTYIPVIQNLELTVSNCHVRIEDTTVNTPVPLAFGIIVKTASVMPGGKGGKQQEEDSSQQQWGGIGPEAKSDPTLVDKVVQAEHVGIYADGDNILSLMTEEEVISMMRNFSLGPSSYMLKPLDLSVHVRYLLSKNKIDIKLEASELWVQVLHDQLHVILSWLRILVAHTHMLQRHTLRSGSSVQNPAALRWRFAISAVLADLRAYRKNWHAYISAWVMASRYQTVRAMLYDHVAVVAMTDSFGARQERFYENLRPVTFEDEKLTQIQVLRLEAEWSSYMLPYELPAQDIQAAWALIKEHTTNNLTSQGLSHRLRLSPRMIQCLYAIQLELDATMPVQCVVFLRLDIACRLRHLESFGPLQKGQSPTRKPLPTSQPSSAAPSPTPELPPGPTGCRLLLALAHGEGFKPLMASSSVDSFCRLSLLDTATKRVTDSAFCKYLAKENVARWHQLFQFDLTPELVATWLEGSGSTEEAEGGGSQSLLTVDCFERMAFMDFSIGSCSLTRAQLLSRPDELQEHECVLEGGFMGGSSSATAAATTSGTGTTPAVPRLRLLSLFFSGRDGDETKAEAMLKRGLSMLQRRQSGGEGMDLAELTSRVPVRRSSTLGNSQTGEAGRGEETAEADDDDNDPMLLALPRLSTCLRLGMVSVTLGLARYQELFAQRKHPEEEEEEGGSGEALSPPAGGTPGGERRFRRRRTLLVETVIKGIAVRAKCWPEHQPRQPGKRAVVTDLQLQLEGLTTFNRQDNEGEDQLAISPRSLDSDGDAEDFKCIPLVRLGGARVGVTLRHSLPENLTTATQLLTWGVTVGLGAYQLRVAPKSQYVGDSTAQTLYSTEKFFAHKKAIAQVVTGHLRSTGKHSSRRSSEDEEGAAGDSSVAAMLQQVLYLALVTGRKWIQFEFHHHEEDDLDGSLTMGPITVSEEDWVPAATSRGEQHTGANGGPPEASANGKHKPTALIDSSRTQKPCQASTASPPKSKASALNGHKPADVSSKQLDNNIESKALEPDKAMTNEEMHAAILRLRQEVAFWKAKAAAAGVDVDEAGQAFHEK